jgi:Thioredoxin-like
MYPHERSLVKRLQGKPFALIGINSDRDRAALKKVMEKEQITWRSFFDGGGVNGPIASKWNVKNWPTIYVIDAKGRIRYKFIGSPSEEIMNTTVDTLIEEAVAKN